MNNEFLILAFLITTPIILVLLGYFSYQYYIQSNKTKVMIDVLSDASHHIIDNKKQRESKKIDTEHFIKRKLNYAGFLSEFAVYIFYFVSIGFGLLVGFFIYLVMDSPIVFAVSSVIFALTPYVVLEKIVSNRQEEFNFGLKSIIDKVTSMMKSGVGFEQAFKKSILTTKSELTKSILSIYLNEKDIIGEEKAFERMFQLVESKEFRIFYLTITIGRQSGGKFSNTLETLRKTLQDQGTIKQEIVASTREIKIGTYMIIALTAGIYFMVNGVFDGALNSHFFGSAEGKLQMFFIILWVSFGLFVNNILTKIKG